MNEDNIYLLIMQWYDINKSGIMQKRVPYIIITVREHGIISFFYWHTWLLQRAMTWQQKLKDIVWSPDD